MEKKTKKQIYLKNIDRYIEDDFQKRENAKSNESIQHAEHVMEKVAKTRFLDVINKNYFNNPHLMQIPACGHKMLFNQKFTRTLPKDFPQLSYRSRSNELKTVEHWGQRKLLLSEIEFLNEYSHLSTNVVYPGGAPGNHIDFLTEMFPKLTFYLIDPNDFAKFKSPKIITIQTYFDVKQVEHLKNMLFICDIRSGKFDENVRNDMELQKVWCQKLKPKAAMLKFHPPYFNGNDKEEYEYFGGKVYLPIWGTCTTTETRLVVTNFENLVKYDCQTYESQLFYFNNHYRPSAFPKHGVKGYCSCYDCTAEIFVLKKYQTMNSSNKYAKMKLFVLRNIISKNISFKGRHLFSAFSKIGINMNK